LVEHVNAQSAPYHQVLNGLTRRLMAAGSDAFHAAGQAQATIAGLIARQAGALAYLDCFRLVSVFCFLLIPVSLFIRRIRPRPGQAVHAE
jgi:hypothetical protein